MNIYKKIYEDGEGYANVKKSTGLVDFLDEEHGKIDMPTFNNEYYDELNGISYIRVLYQFKNNYNTNPIAQYDTVGRRYECFWIINA